MGPVYCQYCNKEIINYNNTDHVYIGAWRADRNFSEVIRFHVECFMSLAGDDYIKILFDRQ